MQKSRFANLLAATGALGLAAFAGMTGQGTTSEGPSAREATSSTAQQGERAPAREERQQVKAARLNWLLTRATRSRFPDGPGWSNRHVQRMARKRKNQSRHKAQCRRQRGDSLIEFLVGLAALGVVVAAAVGYYQAQATATYSYGANGMVETRCIDGSKWVLSRSGMATQMLDKNGRAIACPLT